MINQSSVLERLRAIVGPAHVLTETTHKQAYDRDWRGRYSGSSLAVVRPHDTAETAAVLRVCHDARIPIVPQAGNTGLVGGAVPNGNAIVLSVGRMNSIRAIDPMNNSMIVEAGAILQNVRDEAEKHGRHFPMLLGSVGSCQIGGLVSTNAGGTGVLRYGNMRDLVLGLEVVLPDGRVWNGLRALRKDNTGYDLKQLFVGSEGTLGVVTAAVVKLFPRLMSSATAMVALSDVGKAVELLHWLQGSIGSRIEAFEVMTRTQLDIVCRHGHGLASPMALSTPWYALIEIADSDPAWDATAQLEQTLGEAAEQGLLSDAVFATDMQKAERIWALRHNVSETNKLAGFTISNDTSVPISRVPEFIANVDARLAKSITGATVCHVGHIGDGNVHVVVVLSRDVHTSTEDCEKVAKQVNTIVHEESVALDGSISAEHGIGQKHVAPLARFKPALDLDLMRGVKALFDPLGLMNPGKVLPQRTS